MGEGGGERDGGGRDGGGEMYRDKDRETQRQRERDTDTHRETQTDTQTHREPLINNFTERDGGREMYRDKDRETQRHTETHRHTQRDTDRHRESHLLIISHREAITGSAAQPTAMATGSDDNNTDHVDHPPTQVTSAPVETEPDDRWVVLKEG